MPELRGLILADRRRDDELSQIVNGRAPQALPIANVPLVRYGVDALADCGVREIAVVVTASTRADVEEALGDGRRLGVALEYVECPLRSSFAERLVAARAHLADGPFLVHLGDGLLTQPLGPLVEEFRSLEPDAMVLLEAVEPGAEAEPVERERGLRLVGRADLPPAGAAPAAACILTPAAIEAAAALEVAGLAPDWIGAVAAEIAARGGRVVTHAIEGSWRYGGDIDGLLQANRMVLDGIAADHAGVDLRHARLEGRARIHPTAVLERTTIRGPVAIGAGAVLVDTFIGPYTAIGENTRLEGAEIEYSIVLSGAEIHHIGKRIEASLVGQDASVRRDFALPAAHRLRVGRGADLSLA